MALLDSFKLAYASTRMRAMKGRLFQNQNYAKLIQANSVADLANMLEGTEYGHVFSNGLKKNIIELESDLNKFFVDLLYRISDYYPKSYERVLNLFLMEWEIENLKIIIKSIESGLDHSDLIIPMKGFAFHELAKSKSIEELASKLKGTKYDVVVEKAYKTKYKELGYPFIEFSLDKFYNEFCLGKIKKIKEKEIALDFLVHKNDMINLRNIIRGVLQNNDLSEFVLKPSTIKDHWFKLKKIDALLEVIRESKDLKISENILSEFVKTNDDFWLEMAFKDSLDNLGLRSIRASPFDLGLTLYFLIMKRNEVNRIKIIARFVKENLPKEELKKIIGTGV